MLLVTFAYSFSRPGFGSVSDQHWWRCMDCHCVYIEYKTIGLLCSLVCTVHAHSCFASSVPACMYV